MSNKSGIAALILALVAIAISGVVYTRLNVAPSQNQFGIGSTDEFQLKNFRNTLVANCLKVYQIGATTNSSSTFYVVASTTIGGASVSSSLPLFATSTKPAFCP